MPLIKCKDCGHDISTDAKVCQNCGRLTSKSFWGRRRAGSKYSTSGCLVQIVGIILSVVTFNLLPLIISLIISAVLLVKEINAVKNMDNPD